MSTKSERSGNPVHEVKHNPEKGGNDVSFGPRAKKAGHAAVKDNGEVVYPHGHDNPKDNRASTQEKAPRKPSLSREWHICR